MKKLLILSAVLMAAIVSVYAEVDPKAMPIIQDIQQGRNNRNAITDLYVKDAATIVGDAAVGGALAVTGDLTLSGSAQVSGLLRSVPTALSVTNGQVVTVAEQVYLVSGINGAAATTNAFTLANPGTALLGLEVTFIVAGSSTQLVTIADSGNVAASSAWVGGTNDVAKFYAAATNLWVQSGEEDN